MIKIGYAWIPNNESPLVIYYFATQVLTPALPTEVAELPVFEANLSDPLRLLTDRLQSFGFGEASQLRQFLANVHTEFMRKRQASILDRARALLVERQRHATITIKNAYDLSTDVSESEMERIARVGRLLGLEETMGLVREEEESMDLGVWRFAECQVRNSIKWLCLPTNVICVFSVFSIVSSIVSG